MMGPLAHFVRYPPQGGAQCPSGGRAGTEMKPPRSLRSLPPEGALSALRAAGQALK